MSLYVFCDNSNIYIEGRWAAGRLEGIKGPSPEFRLDFGYLLKVCANGRPVSAAYLYGSTPPPNDSVWKAAERGGWDVKTIERNLADKEKGLDIQIALDMNDLSRDVTPPGTMLLLAGDGDYQTLIPRLQGRGWAVEIWFYNNVAGSLKTLADFHSLEDRLHESRLK